MRVGVIITCLTLVPICSAATRTGAPRTGTLQLTFTERSPLSDLDKMLPRVDADLARQVPPYNDPARHAYDVAAESFDVVVPPAYRDDVPHGLFVWMGNTAPNADWMPVLARHKLIFLEPKNMNSRTIYLRYCVTLDGVHNMAQRYNIDPKRVFVSGFSAGAGRATHILAGFPDVFRGGLFLMGGRYYVGYKNVTGRKEITSIALAPKWKGPAEQIKAQTALVFMRGQGDNQFDPGEDRIQLDGLLLDGFERLAYFEVPRVGHANPNAYWFEKGIGALDNTRPRKRPTTSPTAEARPLPGQIAQAARLLASAKFFNQTPNARHYAHPWLQRVLDDYPTTPAAKEARKLTDNPPPATQPTSSR